MAAKIKIKAAKKKGIDPAVIKKHTKKLKPISKELEQVSLQHGELVDTIAELVQAARKDNVPMKEIQKATGLSRQWLYNMNKMEKRNGKG